MVHLKKKKHDFFGNLPLRRSQKDAIFMKSTNLIVLWERKKFFAENFTWSGRDWQAASSSATPMTSSSSSTPSSRFPAAVSIAAEDPLFVSRLELLPRLKRHRLSRLGMAKWMRISASTSAFNLTISRNIRHTHWWASENTSAWTSPDKTPLLDHHGAMIFTFLHAWERWRTPWCWWLVQLCLPSAACSGDAAKKNNKHSIMLWRRCKTTMNIFTEMQKAVNTVKAFVLLFCTVVLIFGLCTSIDFTAVLRFWLHMSIEQGLCSCANLLAVH